MLRILGLAILASVGLLAAGVACAQGPSTSTIYASDAPYNVSTANSRAANNAGIQAAITDAIASGRKLQLPAGVLATSANFTCPGPVEVAGSMASGLTSVVGTTIDSNITSGDLFTCITFDAVNFHDLTLTNSGSGTTGAAIRLQTANLAVPSCQRGARINNVTTYKFGTGISLIAACNYNVFNNLIFAPTINGIVVSTKTNALIDIGDASIYGNTIWDINLTATGTGILLDPGPVTILANKVLGFVFGIRLSAGGTCPTNCGTGTLLISHNSIEQFAVQGFSVGQAVSGSRFAFIDFSHNQLQATTAGMQGAIVINPGTANYIPQLNIADNIINLTSSTYGASACVLVGDGDMVNVHDNKCNLNSIPGSYGYVTYGNATLVQFGNNQAKGYATRYSCGVPTKVLDATVPAYASWSNC